MNKQDYKHFSFGFIFPFILPKHWFYFSDPFEYPKCAMVNFFSYNKVLLDGFHINEGNTSVIDLTKPLDEIWGGMRKKFIQKQIEKGQRNGIEVKNDKNYTEFKNIYEHFRKEIGLPSSRLKLYAENGIMFNAYYENKMIAGSIFISNGKSIRALVLASMRHVEENRMKEIIGQANRMVIWEAIKYAKDTGHTEFDLGGISPNSKNKSLVTLAEFKESFGGTRKKCYYYYKIYSKIILAWFRLKGKKI